MLRTKNCTRYAIHQEKRGQVGYSIIKLADTKMIHPSKRHKACSSASMSAPSSDTGRRLTRTRIRRLER